jgi:adenylosuccinate synthase
LPGSAYSPDDGVQQTPPGWTDPTENVKSLFSLNASHQEQIRHINESHQEAMRNELARRLDEKADITAKYEDKLRRKESERIDAIREVSDQQVQRAAEVQAQQQQTLATQVATTADAFRASLAAALAPIQAAIEDLRRAQYEAQGQKTQVVETREVQGANRLSWGTVLGGISVLLILIFGIATIFLTKHG